MEHMEISVRRVGEILIFYAKDFDGEEIHPDIGEVGLRRILAIFAERLKRKTAAKEQDAERKRTEDAFRDLVGILVESLEHLPDGEARRMSLGANGQFLSLRWAANGEQISVGYSPEADWVRKNSQ